MTKNDLRTGMCVTLRNGDVYYVMLNTGKEHNDILIRKCGTQMGWMPLEQYDLDMRYHDDPDDIFPPGTAEEQAEWDIIKVQETKYEIYLLTGIDYETIWERSAQE